MEMPEARWYAGLDVHKDTVSVAVMERFAAEPELEVVKPNRLVSLSRLLAEFAKRGEVLAGYEAGPTGYGLARSLRQAGVECCVLAPGKLPRAALERVKTDRRDAVKLARALRAGEAVKVRIPTATEEAVREYVRTRHELKLAGAKAKNRLQAVLLRHDLRYGGKGQWTKAHWRWIQGIRVEHPELQESISRRADTVAYFDEQVRQMDGQIKECAARPSFMQQVQRLRYLKGIGTYTALALISEVGDFRRFPTARAFMAFLGLVPSEHSSGPRRRTGGITKTGNSFLRALLIEAGWHYAYPERSSEKLRRKRRGQSGRIAAYAARASERLHRVYCRLSFRRHNGKVAVVAVARELAGFVWGIMTDSTL